jgi:hypothetical protein
MTGVGPGERRLEATKSGWTTNFPDGELGAATARSQAAHIQMAVQASLQHHSSMGRLT